CGRPCAGRATRPARNRGLPRAPPAIDGNGHARHGVGHRRCEVDHRPHDVLDLVEVDAAWRALAQELPVCITLRIVELEYLVDRRLDRAGGDGVHCDAVRRELAGQCLGEVDHAALGGAVGGAVEEPAEPGNRGHVHDLAAAPFPHLGGERLGAEEHALEVDVEPAVPDLFGGIVDGHHVEYARIVDENVDGAVVGERPTGHLLDLADLRHVAAQRDRIAAAVADRGGHRLCPRLVEVGDHHASTLPGECLGKRLTEPLRSSRDERDLVFEHPLPHSGSRRWCVESLVLSSRYVLSSAREEAPVYDTVIRGARIATAADLFEADVAISEGRICALGENLGPARETIEAEGLLALPGGIDSHVHISQLSGEGIVMAEDFESGTRAAACGGNTTILPFCLQQRGQSLRQALTGYDALARGRSHVDVSFHLIVSDPTEQVLGQELPALVAEGYTSIKVFMTYEGLALRDREILEVMAVARETGALVMVHAENEDAIRFLWDRAERAGETAPKHHATTRPIPVEREATHRALSLAEIAETPVVIVHVSNRESMEEIARARARGIPVAGETCPQYLVLTAEDLGREGMEGAKFVCSPPPRDVASQIACWEGIEQGVFDVFSSDHCPFRFDDEAG